VIPLTDEKKVPEVQAVIPISMTAVGPSDDPEGDDDDE
jgi:hypothetical protein